MKQLKNNKNLIILVDDDDYEKIKNFKWFIITKGDHNYVGRSSWVDNKSKRIYLHREIMNHPENKLVDHINGNTLDNRKENLRICDKKENCRNHKKRKSGNTKYTGVSKFPSKSNPFSANITVDYKLIYLGCYKTEIEAAKAYDQAAKKYFGEYARLNFPDE